MTPGDALATGLIPGVDAEDVLLTRAEASEYLSGLGIHMKPATLAQAYSRGSNGPPCAHIRGKPYYPRAVLHRWAMGQVTGLKQCKQSPASSPCQT